jgi:hypothetical protein
VIKRAGLFCLEDKIKEKERKGKINKRVINLFLKNYY